MFVLSGLQVPASACYKFSDHDCHTTISESSKKGKGLISSSANFLFRAFFQAPVSRKSFGLRRIAVRAYGSEEKGEKKTMEYRIFFKVRYYF